MALSIRAQALSLLLACALGLGAGLLYDLFRPVRRRSGSALWDLLFCLAAAAAAFLFAMHAESGRFGSMELLACLFSLLLYFELLSPVCLPVFGFLDLKFRVICINTQNFAKKVCRAAKKLFQKRRE